MELLRGIFGKGSSQEGLPSISNVLKNNPTSRVWPYSYFKEYLLALGAGRKFLLPECQYPDLIELSKNWIDTLNQMNSLTQDGNEYYVPIGYRLLPVEARALLLPQKPYRGSRGMVTREILDKAREDVRYIGTEGILGDIHSHPSRNHLVFSVGDMLKLLTPYASDYLMGVVGDNQFLFGFRTRETTPSIFSHSQAEFCKFWYSQHGYSFVEHDSDRGEIANRVGGNYSMWDINTGIAQAHHLVLFSGDYQTGLVKVFPTAQQRNVAV